MFNNNTIPVKNNIHVYTFSKIFNALNLTTNKLKIQHYVFKSCPENNLHC